MGEFLGGGQMRGPSRQALSALLYHPGQRFLWSLEGSALKHFAKASAVFHLIYFTNGETEALRGTGSCPGSFWQDSWKS